MTLRIIMFSIILQIKQSMARPMYRFCLIVQPIAYLIIMYSLFRISGQEDFMSFVVLGTGFITLWSTIAFSTAGDLDRERRMGTLKVLFTTTTDYRIVVISKALGNTLLGLIPLTLLIIFAMVSGQSNVAEPGWFILSLLLSIVSFLTMSLVFSAIFTLSRETRVFMNCLEYPVYILCGIVFPVSYLPKWLQMVSLVMSPTWGIELLRDSVKGSGNYSEYIQKVCILPTLSVIYFILAVVLLKIIERRVRITASLEVG